MKKRKTSNKNKFMKERKEGKSRGWRDGGTCYLSIVRLITSLGSRCVQPGAREREKERERERKKKRERETERERKREREREREREKKKREREREKKKVTYNMKILKMLLLRVKYWRGREETRKRGAQREREKKKGSQGGRK